MPERAKHDKSEAPRISRLERMRKAWANEEPGRFEDDYRPDMPPLDGAEHLITYLYEIGPTLAAGMGAGPITQLELRAWMGNMGIELRPWEVRMLRRLSVAYLVEARAAEKRDSKAPWRAAGAKPEVSDTQAAIRALANL